MPEWQPIHDAPRGEAVMLFLPGAKWQSDERGRARPGTIENVECVGIWDADQSHWVDRDTRARVYPSKWRAL